MSLYGTIWRLLPGPWPVKAVLAALLLAAAVYALFTWAFPVMEPYMPGSDVTIEEHP
ncbi:MAG: hypothetical protein LCH76_09875 [Actinobacteria bacterium]|nr:hypothetical protein [Actinomycetota bacterium]